MYCALRIAPWAWPRLPFGADIALVTTACYAAGAWLRDRPDRWPQRPLPAGASLALAAVCLALLVAITAFNGQPDLNRMVLGLRPALFYAGAAIGIVAVFALATALPATAAARRLAASPPRRS